MDDWKRKRIGYALNFGAFMMAFLTLLFTWVGGIATIVYLATNYVIVGQFLALSLGILFTGIMAMVSHFVLGVISDW